jgi:3-hydroxyisobutyrate dehydrogenase-like beta-hydroxyacid dehydrogenase
MTYGFIGLGHQGTPMAERMIAGGLRPWLWARRREVLDRYTDTDAQVATSPAQVAAEADVIGLCMYDAEATDAVLWGPDGIMSAVRPGTVLAVHATVGPAYVKDLAARAAPYGVHVVDAPVSGGPAAAEGKLLVIVSGDEEPRARCAPMFATYAGRVVPVGKLGTAQAAKLINNSLMTAITGLVFDAFDLGATLGIERDGLADVLGNGSAANPSIPVYAAIGAEEFSIRAWPTLHKDVALMETLGVPTPQLVDVARTTIADMAVRRADYVASHSAT